LLIREQVALDVEIMNQDSTRTFRKNFSFLNYPHFFCAVHVQFREYTHVSTAEALKDIKEDSQTTVL